MAGDKVPSPTFTSKKELYEWLAGQTEALVVNMSTRFTPQANLIIGLGNVAALCFYELNRFADPNASLSNLRVNWFGFYMLQASGVLALGPFQGRPACTEIKIGRGVCGTAAESAKTLVVSDVHAFPGHIACDSASESEVVVPITTDNGAVVAVIDVDSTVCHHFDEEDGKGLETIAQILSKHLEFPMSRALRINPSLTSPAFAATGGSSEPISARLGQSPPAVRITTIPTKVTCIPSAIVEAMPPQTVVECVSDWQFTVTRLDRISSQSELRAMEDAIGIAAFPEILFLHNKLEIALKDRPDSPILHFELLSLLQNAALFYRNSEYIDEIGPQISIPVSESWSTSAYDRFDPHVDWAWRNNFFGLGKGVHLRALAEDMDGINWDLLHDQSLPIVLFDTFDLLEDDLHDHGCVKSSVKFRVMPTAFFILLRHIIRVDGHGLWAREVRFFHEFGKQIEGDTPSPAVVVVEQIRKYFFDGVDDCTWKDIPIDEVCQKAQVVRSREYYLDITQEEQRGSE